MKRIFLTAALMLAVATTVSAQGQRQEQPPEKKPFYDYGYCRCCYIDKKDGKQYCHNTLRSSCKFLDGYCVQGSEY